MLRSDYDLPTYPLGPTELASPSMQIDDSVEHDAPEVVADERTPRRPAGHLIALGAIVLFGAFLRSRGLQNHDLWYDDAWIALPTHSSFVDAMRLTISNPGFGAIARAWILLDPHSTLWALLLPFSVGCVAPVAFYWLGREMNFSRMWALGIALFIAVSPDPIQHAARFKSYSCELLFGAVLLALTQRYRRTRSTSDVVVFGIVAALGAVTAASIMIVALSCVAALIAEQCRHRRLTRSTLAVGGGLGLICLAVAIEVHRAVPQHLHEYWSDTHNMMTIPPTLNDVAATVATSTISYLHGAVGLPIGVADLASSTLTTSGVWWHAEVVLSVVAVAFMATVPLLQLLAGRRDLRLLPPATVLLAATAAWALGVYPLGTGRTDSFTYGAFVVLTCTGLRMLVDRRPRPLVARRAATALVCGGAVLLGIHFHAWCPRQDLRTIVAEVRSHATPLDLVIVSHRNAYTWALDDLTPTTIVVARSAPESASVGYYVASLDPAISFEGPTEPDAWAVAPPPGATRIWVITTTNLNLSPSLQRFTGPAAAESSGDDAVVALGLNGWKVRSVLHAPGEIAYLLTPRTSR